MSGCRYLILDVSLNDQRQAWMMTSEGYYTQLRPDHETEGLELAPRDAAAPLTRVAQRAGPLHAS